MEISDRNAALDFATRFPVPNSAVNKTDLKLFAACPPGLEPWLADELRELGVAPAIEEGGCTFDGDLAMLYRANLQLRIASRVLLRVGHFHVGHFAELEKKVTALPWAQLLKRGIAIRTESVCYRSKLYHEKAVNERMDKYLAQKLGATKSADRESGQLVMLRNVANECTISIDSSGELLHRRGYRQELTKATLRETLAASLLAIPMACATCSADSPSSFAQPTAAPNAPQVEVMCHPRA